MNRTEVKREVILAYKNTSKSNDLDQARNNANRIYRLYLDWQEEIKKAIEKEDFKDVNGMDWNEYYHDLEYFIRELYFRVKSIYHDLHWEKYSFNAY